jgi:hypothetical protein
MARKVRVGSQGITSRHPSWAEVHSPQGRHAGRARRLARGIFDDSVAAWLAKPGLQARCCLPLPILVALITTWLASQWQMAGGWGLTNSSILSSTPAAPSSSSQNVITHAICPH